MIDVSSTIGRAPIRQVFADGYIEWDKKGNATVVGKEAHDCYFRMLEQQWERLFEETEPRVEHSIAKGGE